MRGFREMKMMARALLPKLEWRWHGAGVLQAYVSEGEDQELRLHIWHPRLVLPGIRHAGDCHNHRFDFQSTILTGEILMKTFEIYPNQHGPYTTYTFKHCRIAVDNPVEMTPTGERYGAHTRIASYSATGDREYYFRKHLYHWVRPANQGIAVTMVRKFNQEEKQAFVLAPVGVKAIPAFSGVLTDELRDTVIEDGVKYLTASL